VETGDTHVDAVIPHIRKVQPLAEELLPAVFAVRRGGVGRLLGALGIVGIALVVLGINARRRRVEELSDARLHAEIEDVQVDRRGVVHHGGVVLAGEDVAGAAHVRRQLVHDVDIGDDGTHHTRIA
jgi:hypothetical protein